MRTRSRIIPAVGIVGGIVACPATLVFGIEPPPDLSKPPAALRGYEAASPKLPFLGLATTELPEMLAEHLSIEKGTALVVRTVCPDSPAAKAGIAIHDILLSVDGNKVASPEDFSARIRGRKIGDTLTLDLIRKGQPTQAKVTLVERPPELLAHLDHAPVPQGMPQAQADRIRDLLEGNLRGLGADPFGTAPDERLDNTFRMMRERMNQAFGADIPPILQGEDGGIRFQQNSTVKLMDGEGSVEIRSSDGDNQVTVRDKDNQVVWQGPWNDEKDKEAAPAEIRKRIDAMQIGSNNGKGFTFRFGKLGGDGTIDN